MLLPDTSLSKVCRVATETRLWFAAPAAVSSSAGPLVDFPEVTFTEADGSSTTVSLSEPFPFLAVASSPNRRTLTLSASYVGAAPTLGWGDALLYSPALGTIPIRIESVNGTTLKLVDPLPADLPALSDTEVQPAAWFTDEGPGAPLATVTRTAQGDLPVTIEVEWFIKTGSASKTTVRERGTLSVVLRPFSTGLTTAGLRRLYPELGGMASQGSAGFEGIIARTLGELALRVRADVREAGASPYTWEDDLDGAPFLHAHAAYAAAAALDATNPTRAEALRQLAKPLYTSARQSAWFDRNRSGTVQLGESPGLVGAATAASIAPSYIPTPNPNRWRIGEPR